MKPYQQGSLDGLCGLYAIMNAIRLAGRPYRAITHTFCEDLYIALVKELDRQQGMASAIEYGMSSVTVARLLRAAKSYLAEKTGLRLHWSRPYYRVRPKSAKSALAGIKSHLMSDNCSVIAGVTLNDEDHWTVIREVRDRLVLFHDSDGRKHALISKLKMDAAAYGDDCNVLYGGEVFQILVV